MTAVADVSTSKWCPDGLAPGRIVVSVPTNPDVRLHRYTGDPANPIRNATAQEIADADAEQADAVAKREIDNARALRAMLITGLWGRLNRQPTVPEIAAERTRFIAVYKALG